MTEQQITPTYYRISPKFWSDPMVRRWDDDHRMLAFYVLTSDHRNTEGLYRLPVLYGCADLGGWSEDRYRAALDRLIADGFIEWDEDAEVVLIVKALATQSPDNGNQAKGAVKKLLGVPASPLDRRFGELAARYSRRLYDVLPDRFTGGGAQPPTDPDGNGSTKGSTKGSANGSPNPPATDPPTDTQPSSSCSGSGSYSSSPSARAHTREAPSAPAVDNPEGEDPRPPQTRLRALPDLDAIDAAEQLLEHLPGKIAARVHGRHRERLGRTVAEACANGWTPKRLATAIKALDADLGGLDQLDHPGGTRGAIESRIKRVGPPPHARASPLPCAACDGTGFAGEHDGYMQPCLACRPQGFHDAGHTVSNHAERIGDVLKEALP